jgi:hypothetical protein
MEPNLDQERREAHALLDALPPEKLNAVRWSVSFRRFFRRRCEGGSHRERQGACGVGLRPRVSF